MKLKENLILRQVAGNWIVVPVGQASLDLNGLLTLNDSGAMLWRELEKGADLERLTAALLEEYQVAPAQARADAEQFAAVIRKAGCLMI